MSSYGAIDVPLNENSETSVARSFDPVLLQPNTLQRSGRSQTLQNRRPYYYPHSTIPQRTFSQNSLTSVSDSVTGPSYHREHNMAIRYRFFNRLDPGGSHLMMPAHLISSELFSILPFNDFKDQEGKQGSIVTIFSIWNTMMGTSLLAMPWAIQQAGFALGIFFILIMALLAFYTAYRVIESPNGLILSSDASAAEFSDVCRYFYGKTGEFIASFFSIIVLFGGIIVYFVLMSNFLFFTGNIFYESLQPNSSVIPVMANKTFTCDIYCVESTLVSSEVNLINEITSFDYLPTSVPFTDFWKLQGSVPIILALITFPLLNFKSPTFFTKFNVLVFDMKCPALTGTLALSYFIHNAILTILRNQKNPENNVRDLSIGYSLSAICYVFIGVVFFIAFPTRRSCISDNFLNNFGTGDVMSATARVFLLFQMFTVLPLLLYLVRVQFSYVFAGTVYPGLFYVCLINLGVVTVATFFAVVYPHVGSILRLFGSFSGLVYIFALPCLVHMSRLKMQEFCHINNCLTHYGPRVPHGGTRQVDALWPRVPPCGTRSLKFFNL